MTEYALFLTILLLFALNGKRLKWKGEARDLRQQLVYEKEYHQIAKNKLAMQERSARQWPEFLEERKS